MINLWSFDLKNVMNTNYNKRFYIFNTTNVKCVVTLRILSSSIFLLTAATMVPLSGPSFTFCLPMSHTALPVTTRSRFST